MFVYSLRPGLDLRLVDFIDADEQFTLLQSQSDGWETFWAWDQPFSSVGHWQSYVQQIRQRHAEENALLAAIYAQGRCIGHVGLDRLTARRAEVQGWVIPGEAFGAAFREALIALMDYAFAVWGVHRIEVRPAADQTGYISHLQAVGFQPEATVRQALLRRSIRHDAMLHSVLASDWAVSHPHIDFMRRIDADLALRPFEIRDAFTLFNQVDANRAHLRPWLTWVDDTQSPMDSEQFIRAARKRYGERNGWEGGIWWRGELIGSVGYHGWDFQAGTTEIGYWLAQTHTGQGIMTRVVRAMTDDALFDLGLNRVVINCAAGNKASNAIPQRLGYTQEGVLREMQWLYDRAVDWNTYAMLSADWSALAEND